VNDRAVRITEVGPRDGLQNEKTIVPAAEKIALVDALSSAAFPEIEVTSFVSPRWVPQLADATEVLAGIERRDDVVYSALVPNEKGLDRAMAAGVDKLSVFTAASEEFCQANLNTDIAGSLERFQSVFDTARSDDIPLRGYISCVVECPYAGRIDPVAVRDAVARLLDAAGGRIEIALGETLGVAGPEDIEAVLEAVGPITPLGGLDLHLHDTRGRAIECVSRALELGVRRFDSSCAGLGGCPYAPGAAGNLATERLLDHLVRGGWETGVDESSVAEAATLASRLVGPAD